jgi:penicillin-binding protein 1A
MGYDTPRKLGDRETGGGLSLPVWISFMETALRGVPVSEPPVPEGVVNVNGDWMFDEFTKGGGISTLGTGNEGTAKAPAPIPPGEEKSKILDLFRN